MIGILAFLCLAALATSQPTSEVGIRILQLDEQGGPIYVPVYRTLKELQENNYVKAELPSNVPENFISYVDLYALPNERSLGLYVHKETGNVVGMNFAIDQEYLSEVVTNYPKAGFSRYSVEQNGVQKNFWSTLAFFTCDPSSITSATWDSSKIVQGDKMCVLGLDGELTELYVEMAKNPAYGQQKCLDGGGIHYFRNLSSTTECSEENLFPWYMYSNCDGYMMGLGFFTYAKYELPKGQRTYAVDWDETVIPITFDDYPQCLLDLATNPGIPGFELWIEPNPQDFRCDQC